MPLTPFYVPGDRTTLSIFAAAMFVPNKNSNSSRYWAVVAVEEIEFESHTPGLALSLASTVYCGCSLNLTPMKPPLPAFHKELKANVYCVLGVM
jgi:hypothetical protein